jgi:hypothetical protein
MRRLLASLLAVSALLATAAAFAAPNQAATKRTMRVSRHVSRGGLRYLFPGTPRCILIDGLAPRADCGNTGSIAT